MQYSGDYAVLFRNFAKLLAIIVNKTIRMLQTILGFEIDEEYHYVALLSCGHRQHMSHLPPWQNRPWVMSAQGRQEKIATPIDCKQCDFPKNSL